MRSAANNKKHYSPVSLSISSSATSQEEEKYGQSRTKYLQDAQDVLENQTKLKGNRDNDQISQSEKSSQDSDDSINSKQRIESEDFYQSSDQSDLEKQIEKDLSELLQIGFERLEQDTKTELLKQYQFSNTQQVNEILAGKLFNFQNQVKLFHSLYKQGYFTNVHQKKVRLQKDLNLIQKRNLLQAQLDDIEATIQNMQQTEQIFTTLFLSDDQSTQDCKPLSQDFYMEQLRGFDEFRTSQDSARTLSYISEMETDNPKSEYNKQRRRDIKELSKQFAKDAIKRHNKKQLQAFTFTTESRLPGRMRPSLNELVDEDFDISWVHTSERFKNFNRTKQILTIPPTKAEDIDDYRKQEIERYKYPLDPWMYSITDGRKAIVGPVFRKRAQIQNRPREHLFLKSERPPGVNILALVRDAAARLPDQVGTRTDVAELVKDSQFLAEGLTDYYISQTVSGGLDRLSAEEDPSVRFDPSSKLWIYLHGKRTLDSSKWATGINECTKKAFEKNNEKFFTSGFLVGPTKSAGGNSNETTDIGTSHGLPATATNEKISNLLKAENINHVSVNIPAQSDNGTGTIYFNSRPDFVKAASAIRSLKLDDKNLNFRVQTYGDYNPSTSVFVKFFSDLVSDQDLIQEFSQCGLVLSLMVNPTMINQFVVNRSSKINRLRSRELDGKQLKNHQGSIQVRLFEQPQKTFAQNQAIQNDRQQKGLAFQRKSNLFVKGIPFNVDENFLRELFGRYGKLRSVMLKRFNIPNQQAQPFFTSAYSIAYIDYEREEDALKAIDELNHYIINGALIQVEMYEKSSQNAALRDSTYVIGNENLRAIFIRNIKRDVTEQRLKEICSKFGNVLDCQLKTYEVDGEVRSKGTAQVIFSKKEEASEAIKNLYYEDDLGDKMDVDFFKLKEARIQEMDKQMNPFNSHEFQRMMNNNRTPQYRMQYQQQRPQIYNAQDQQQRPRQQPFENAQQYQNVRTSMPQQQTQYRARPRQQNRGNQQQQHSYQKRAPGQYPRPGQPMGQYQGGFNQPQPMMPMNQFGAPFQQTQPIMGFIPPQNQQMRQFVPTQMQQQIPIPQALVLFNLNEYQSKTTLAEQKEYIGNLIYDFIEQRYPQEAPKITGMILDQKPEELMKYVANRDLFYNQVDIANQLIQQEKAKALSQQQQ
ncbi:UNKNOWN [Stylonychia lemnae]|uniref:Uncharacterized protein n=1 Tax=Stylonychia lemnae TaxID=5949 RepID=A0A077ZX78_STYLE|nr:UNKNOWN [Stylonychia lemnae]|eukprot:CDW73136.1 UNKNOWN [Stylonychia lemnae]